jgi:hypothetical protein
MLARVMRVIINVEHIPSHYVAVEWYTSKLRVGLSWLYMTSPCTWEGTDDRYTS